MDKGKPIISDQNRNIQHLRNVLASLETAWLADEIADQYADEFDVNGAVRKPPQFLE